MRHEPRSYVFLGLSITSSWGNGHATTYRALLKELNRRGHEVTFLERDVPWYAANREFDTLPYCRVLLYRDLDQLRDEAQELVSAADAVVVGSYVPEGIAVGRWIQSCAKQIKAFYDIDTPVTLAGLRDGRCEYLTPELIPGYDLYLSFTGGPTLGFIERELSSPCARALYCSVDPALYYPEPRETEWDLAYLGTYAADRQPALDTLLLSVAAANPLRTFVVAGPQYPSEISWPVNVYRIEHLPAADHRKFYCSQHFALNLTRRDMVRAGYSPSVRLFEAAACGIPILTDTWPGLDEFFEPGEEILPVKSAEDVTAYLNLPPEQRRSVAEKARARTLRLHTAEVRASEFDRYVRECLEEKSRSTNWMRSRVTVGRSAVLQGNRSEL